MANKGSFIWHELATRDPKTATDFYNKVVGWGNTPWGTDYTIFTRTAEDNTGVGGMMEMKAPDFPEEIPSHLMGYIKTDDVDGAAERVKELGGKIHHGPADIPEVGRFAVAEDPQGAYFSLLQPSSPENPEEQDPQIGEFSWNELMTSDHAAAFDFYKDLFDWQIDQETEIGGGMIYRLFRPNGGKRTIGGMFTKSADMPGPTTWFYYVSVPDINAAVDAVKENGGQVLNGPMQVPGGDMIAQCTDPEGTFFALHAFAATSAAE